MNWNRTKVILIFLFFLINVFLFNMLGKIEERNMTIDDDAINNTISIAQNAGVEISKEIIPNKRLKNGEMELFGICSEPEILAERILGKGATLVKKSTLPLYYKYENKGKILEIENGKFTYVDEKANVKPKAKEQSPQKAIFGLEKFGISPKNVTIVSKGIKNEKNYVSVMPYYKGLKVHGVLLDVFYDGNEITSLSGNWFDLSDYSEDNSLLTDITLVLTSLSLGERKNIKISEIQMRYYVPQEHLGGRYVSAIPVYILKLADGEKIVIDARTGESLN